MSDYKYNFLKNTKFPSYGSTSSTYSSSSDSKNWFARTQNFITKSKFASVLKPVLLILSVIIAYTLARIAALYIIHQKDVIPKRWSDHLDDLEISIFAVLMMCLLIHPQHAYTAMYMVPIVALIYALISDLKPFRASINKPTPALIAVLVITCIFLLILIGWCLYKDFKQVWKVILSICFVFGIVLIHFVTTKFDGNTAAFHPHHWMIGLVIAFIIGWFNPWIAGLTMSIGLGMFIHGVSIYRTTSMSCNGSTACKV